MLFIYNPPLYIKIEKPVIIRAASHRSVSIHIYARTHAHTHHIQLYSSALINELQLRAPRGRGCARARR